MQNSFNRIGRTRLVAVIGIAVCGFVLSDLAAEKAKPQPDSIPARNVPSAGAGGSPKAQTESPASVTQDATSDEAFDREYRARRSAEKHAIEKFEAAGLKCRVKPLADWKLAQWASQRGLPPIDIVVGVSDISFKTTDSDLAQLAALSDVSYISLSGTRISDEGLQFLSGLKRLRTLYIGDTAITDEGVAQIRDLAELRDLWLRGTLITDAAIADLKNFDRLEHLLLDRTSVGDTGIAHLQNMKALRSLGLSKTRVTDAGLLRLTRLTNLKSLDLYNTKVTDAGVAKLRKALPELTVNRKAPGFDFQAGPEEARQDIKSGKLRYMLYGQPQAHDVLFGQILKADYGITLVEAGCRVSEESRVQADGYNKVIHEYLEQQSKEGVIKEAEAKARQQWNREYTEAKARHDLAPKLRAALQEKTDDQQVEWLERTIEAGGEITIRLVDMPVNPSDLQPALSSNRN